MITFVSLRKTRDAMPPFTVSALVNQAPVWTIRMCFTARSVLQEVLNATTVRASAG